MLSQPIVISLPTADRPRAYAFYQEALGLEAVGEPAEDGVPEPLQFVVNDGVRLMLVPHGGFGWALEGRDLVEPGTQECLLGVSLSSAAEVDALIERASAAGAEVVSTPTQHEWGYTGTFADPDGHMWSVLAQSQG